MSEADPADRSALEAQLRHLQRFELVGTMVGSVVHDLNNLLLVIGGGSALLEERPGLGAAEREEIAEIRRASERAAHIAQRLLATTRRGTHGARPVDLGVVVDGFRRTLQHLAGPRVTLEVRRGVVPAVIADAALIEQVLMNLVVNARDAMPDGGRLVIETERVELDAAAAGAAGVARAGTYSALAVTDTGIGLDAATQRRIFEPFFTTKASGQGTGLGLSIVLGIVRDADGEIVVRSELGRGTTFRIYLPASREPVSDRLPVMSDGVLAPRTLPAITVLVVDSDPDVCASLARILDGAGCHALRASTAAEARSLCAGHDADIEIVLVEDVLPDARGADLVAELGELRPRLRAIVMAGDAESSGGRDRLVKPFTPAQLRLAIARALDRSGGVAPPPLAALRARIVLADDDEGFRRTLARVLRKAGFDVVEADSGRAAITALEAAPADVVLADIHMPHGDGLELLRAVRRIDLDMPVLLMSGKPALATAAAAVEYGAFRYLAKPFENEAIVRLVRHAARARLFGRLRRDALLVSGTQVGAADRAGLEVRFASALAQLTMFYQPVVHARTGELFGSEALVRSGEPTLATPLLLLDAATRLGRTSELGRRVRELAAGAMAAAPAELALFVNLHPSDLEDDDLVAPAAALTAIASRVVLEVTERAALPSGPKLAERIARVRELGFRLAVDDIGAGFSGLTTFAELTPEIVKIDMSLVRDVHLAPVKQRTIAALCGLCHEVGGLVVAEGIESADERDAIVSLGCDLAQGYYFGRPAPGPPG